MTRNVFPVRPCFLPDFSQSTASGKPMGKENAVAGRGPEHAERVGKKQILTRSTHSLRSLACKPVEF